MLIAFNFGHYYRFIPRRAGGAANDPYVNEMWEHACHEGNKATDHMRDLGFRWFAGVVPPN